MTDTATGQSWLSKNWIWILLLLVAGFLIYVFFHKAQVIEFTKQKTIDSLFVVVHQKNTLDSAAIKKLNDSIATVNSTLAATKQNLQVTGLKLEVTGAQIQLLTYQLKHTSPGTAIDSGACEELADKADSFQTLAKIQKVQYDSATSDYERKISILESVQEHTADQLSRTDSALTITKLGADECATDNKKMVKGIKSQSLISKITAGLAIVFLAIVVSDHIK